MTPEEKEAYSDDFYHKNKIKDAPGYLFGKRYIEDTNTTDRFSIVNFIGAETLSIRIVHYCPCDVDFGESHIDLTDYHLKYDDIAAARNALMKEGFSPLRKERWNTEANEFFSKSKNKELRTLFGCMLDYFEYKENDTYTLINLFLDHDVPVLDLGWEALFDEYE